MKTNQKLLSIYLHIPFCIRKCYYCDFLSAPADDDTKERYLQCLITEIRTEAPKYKDYVIQSVFFGGGTPSVLPGEAMIRLMDTLRECFCFLETAEITIEVNPGTVDADKLASYYRCGINRLSIGLQSAQNKELQLLGRIHTYEEFQKTYRDAVKTGFNNINIDLMSAIPGQTMESYQETLRKVLSLKPQPVHISAYSLIIEEGTPFYEKTLELPDEDTDREMYKITDAILKESGFTRYEISNYAKSGYACRHNKVYWKRGNYVGFGIGAASLVENVRFSNDRDINAYIDGWENCRRNPDNIPKLIENVQQLSVTEQMEEFMFLGLRLTEGVSRKEFEALFGKSIEEVYPEVVERLLQQELLVIKTGTEGKDAYLALTDFGLDVSNVVMAEFLKSE